MYEEEPSHVKQIKCTETNDSLSDHETLAMICDFFYSSTKILGSITFINKAYETESITKFSGSQENL